MKGAAKSSPRPAKSAAVAGQGLPVAAAPGAGHRSLEVAFDATASSDADGEIAGYSWDFGDGGTSNSQNPTHTYPAAGTYTVKLTVGEADGVDVEVGSDCVCVHSDTPNALEVAQRVRETIKPYLDAAA